MTDFTSEIAVAKQMRGNISTWRHQATVACAVNPTLWIAVQGVSLHAYLAQLDALDAECVKALERMQPKEGAA
ncbi:MAG TPA: hypothetical protein VIL88_17775 [Devosia sp.]|jgi:hypothetical protein|uniref:hypothetical protein n=1 Tax=Devosia sp. TaxID=1871048 RepID=UPI002F940618